MESHTLYLFLKVVKDPDFEMTVEIQRNKYYFTLMQSVISIQKKYSEIMNKGSIERNFRNKIRRVCKEYDCYIDKYFPFKRPRRQGEKYENLVVTIYHIILKGKLLHVVQSVWK